MKRQIQPQGNSFQYDAHIIPAEVARRMQRERKCFGHLSCKRTGQPKSDGFAQMLDGYTVDQEGLLNNYAVEPEMYVNVPGDLR